MNIFLKHKVHIHDYVNAKTKFNIMMKHKILTNTSKRNCSKRYCSKDPNNFIIE